MTLKLFQIYVKFFIIFLNILDILDLNSEGLFNTIEVVVV